jgi:hypothetical protein
MADKKFDNLSGGIGDLGNILRNQGVADLSWLAVDEEEYRAAEALPKQNLDIIPELQRALAREEGDDVPSVIPLRPHAMVNRNPLDAPSASKADMSNPIRNRVARLVMEGRSPSQIQERVLLEFSEADVRRASEAVTEVMSERGVLGNVYVDARHFPRCHQQTHEDRKLIASCARRSLFVLAKPECGGCVHNRDSRCASMKKALVASVPYGPRLASAYAEQFQAEKRPFPAPAASDPSQWKEALRTAFLAVPAAPKPDGVRTVHTQQPRPAGRQVSSSEVQEFLDRPKAGPAKPLSPAYVKYARRMMDGLDDREFLVASGDPELLALASEYGLLGHTWIDMDAAGSCRKALAYVESRTSAKLAPDFVVRRSASCPNCHCTSDGACSKLSEVTKVVPSVPDYGRRTLATALIRAVDHGRVAASQAKAAIQAARADSDWRSLTAQANLFAPQEAARAYDGARVSVWTGFTGSDSGEAVMDEEEVRRTISGIMNHGASGAVLRDTVLNRYSRKDLAAFPELGARLASEDGVQGHYYLDPTAYADYGAGCNDGASKFRKRGAANVMASAKCTGCTLQTHPGWCSKYAKDLVRSVPADVRMASRRVLSVVKHAAVENPVSAYELSTPMSVDIAAPRKPSIEISMDQRTVDRE